MKQINQSNDIYEKILRDWFDSRFSTAIDQIVVEEATNYILSTKLNQIKNNQLIHDSSFLLIQYLLLFLYIN